MNMDDQTKMYTDCSTTFRLQKTPQYAILYISRVYPLIVPLLRI